MSNTPGSIKVSMLLTGNELMMGDIVDSNSSMIAQTLASYGCEMHYKATIGDDLDMLVSEIKRIATFSDVLIVNGGLGPTVDDLTAEAMAKVLELPIVEHSEALAQIEAWCKAKNMVLNDANRKQALLPKDIEVIENNSGSAPGFTALIEGCQVYCTPGVPYELKQMFREQILPRLPFSKDSAVKRLRFRVFGMGESGIQQRIKQSDIEIPESIELGFRASMPMLEVKIQANRTEDYPALEQIAGELRALLGAHIVTEDYRTIAHVVKDTLLEQSKRVCFAESCTGGAIAAMMTELSGASQVFDAGFVTYSNAMKTKMVGVGAATLEEHGAVSEPVVRQMLEGALKESGADIGVSVSGIAGPNGGTEDKPVGTVWLAWGSPGDIKSHCFFFPVDRKRFQLIVSALAFDLVRRDLLGISEEAVYFKERRKPNS